MGGSFVWPKVSEVAEYRKKARQAMLDVIENTPLKLPVTQESPWVSQTKSGHKQNLMSAKKPELLFFLLRFSVLPALKLKTQLRIVRFSVLSVTIEGVGATTSYRIFG